MINRKNVVVPEVKYEKLAGGVAKATGAFGLILKGFTKISDLFGKKSAEASVMTSKQKKFWNQFSKEHPIPYQQMIERNKRALDQYKKAKEQGTLINRKNVVVPEVKIVPNEMSLPEKYVPKSPDESTKADIQHLSEETGQQMVALLEKILAKDTNIHMDGSLLSTTLARGIDFRGSFGTNR